MKKKEPKVLNNVFSEQLHPFGNAIPDFTRTSEVIEIHKFLYLIFKVENLSGECAVMSLAYIERLLTLTSITLHPTNWRRICLGAIVLASKVWEDMAVWNVDFLNVFPKLKTEDLAKLEREYLTSLQFTVTLKSSVYAKYYFALRSVAEKSDKNFPLQPLTVQGAEKLEAKSSGIEKTVRKNNFQRSHSMDPYTPKDSPIDVDTLVAAHKKQDEDYS